MDPTKSIKEKPSLSSLSKPYEPSCLVYKLTGIPFYCSEYDLKKVLYPYILKAAFESAVTDSNGLNFDFIVVLEKSDDEVRWSRWDGQNGNNTARVIVPEALSNLNPFPKAQAILMKHGTSMVPVTDSVQKLDLVPSDRAQYSQLYRDLMKRPYKLEQPPHPLARTDAAKVISVDCGNFTNDGVFEPACTWTNPVGDFNTLNLFESVRPKKFQVCMTAQGDISRSNNWEGQWMDMTFPNMDGIVIASAQDNPAYRDVYVLAKKPPQFYRRRQNQQAQGSTDVQPQSITRDGFVAAPDSAQLPIDERINFPALGKSDSEFEVLGVPWYIQTCRVYRLKVQLYVEAFNFLQILSPREEQDLKIVVDVPMKDATRTVEGNLLKYILPKLQAYQLEVSLAILKLLLNCNIAPADMEGVISSVNPLVKTGALLAEILDKSAEEMGTRNIRALKRIIQSNSNNQSDDLTTIVPVKAIEDCKKQSTIKVTNTFFYVSVYPAHTELQGPREIPLNSVTDNFQSRKERFLCVTFLDNGGGPYRLEPNVNPEYIISQRIVNFLQQPLYLGGQTFEFLAYSTSGLKERNVVWFFARDDSDKDFPRAAHIRDWIGDWNLNDEATQKLARNSSKWGARMGQAFSYSKNVLSLTPDQWVIEKDVENSSKPPLAYTDGCGFISADLCEEINRIYLRGSEKKCTAFQIRFGGAKGVVYRAPNYLLLPETRQKRSMVLRDSLIKFHVPEEKKTSIPLRIVSAAHDYKPAHFNKPLLKCLEDLKCDSKAILDICKEHFSNMARLSLQDLNSLQDEDAEDEDTPRRFDPIIKVVQRMFENGVTRDQLIGSFLERCLLSRTQNRLVYDPYKEVPIPGSYTVLGLTDDCHVLPKDHVYIRAKGTTVVGQVLIYRNPIIHIGDIQRAQAVSDDELKARIRDLKLEDKLLDNIITSLTTMDNVIFFSQKDDRPLPNKLSGGDLDGDKYHVLTLGAHFWDANLQLAEPANYDPDTTPKPTDNPRDMSKLCEFVGTFIRNDCLGQLSTTLMIIADYLPGGLNNPECKKLSKQISRAVDFQKNGMPVDFQELSKDPYLQIRARPHFTRPLSSKPFYDSHGNFYHSNNLLGQIYDLARTYVNDELPKLDNKLDLVLSGMMGKDAHKPKDFDGAALNDILRNDWGLFEVDFTGRMKSRRCAAVDIFIASTRYNDVLKGIVERRKNMVLNALVQYKVLTGSEDAWTLGPGLTKDQATNLFKYLLFEAWQFALTKYEPTVSPGRAEIGMSYAAVWLYLFYEWTFPV